MLTGVVPSEALAHGWEPTVHLYAQSKQIHIDSHQTYLLAQDLMIAEAAVPPAERTLKRRKARVARLRKALGI